MSIYSPDNLYLVTGTSKNIFVYDSQTFEHLHTLEGHTNSITVLTFSPCGKLLASLSFDRSVIIWDFEQRI